MRLGLESSQNDKKRGGGKFSMTVNKVQRGLGSIIEVEPSDFAGGGPGGRRGPEYHVLFVYLILSTPNIFYTQLP